MTELVDNIVAEQRKEFGKEAATTLADSEARSAIVGFVDIDNVMVRLALGLPGIPLCRITSIAGPVGCGKSTLALHLLASVQQMGGVGVLLDTECAYSSDRARQLGVAVEDLVLLQPSTVETAFRQIKSCFSLVRDKSVDVPLLVAWDTISGTPTQNDLDALAGKGNREIASHARIVSLGMRQLTTDIAMQRVAVVLINQEREDVTTQWTTYTSLASRPIGYHSSLIIRLTRTESITNSDTEMGFKVGIAVQKNRMGPPCRKAVKTPFLYSTGFDAAESLVELGCARDVVKQTGGWYDFKGKKYLRRDLVSHIKEDGEFKKELEQVVEAANV